MDDLLTAEDVASAYAEAEGVVTPPAAPAPAAPPAQAPAPAAEQPLASAPVAQAPEAPVATDPAADLLALLRPAAPQAPGASGFQFPGSQPLAPWQQPIPLTPPAPAVTQTPEQVFDSWLVSKGIDAEEITTNSEMVMLQTAFRQDQFLAQQQAAFAQQQQQAQVQQVRTEVAQIAETYPVFKNPVMSHALVGFWGNLPDHVTLPQAAELFAKQLTTQVRNGAAQQAIQQAQHDSTVPLNVGGAIPSPAAPDDWHLNASEDDFYKTMKSELAAAFG